MFMVGHAGQSHGKAVLRTGPHRCRLWGGMVGLSWLPQVAKCTIAHAIANADIEKGAAYAAAFSIRRTVFEQPGVFTPPPVPLPHSAKAV